MDVELAQIEADEENGKGIKLYLNYKTIEKPGCNFTSIVILKDKEI